VSGIEAGGDEGVPVLVSADGIGLEYFDGGAVPEFDSGFFFDDVVIGYIGEEEEALCVPAEADLRIELVGGKAARGFGVEDGNAEAEVGPVGGAGVDGDCLEIGDIEEGLIWRGLGFGKSGGSEEERCE
jgi:hypothetical protein